MPTCSRDNGSGSALPSSPSLSKTLVSRYTERLFRRGEFENNFAASFNNDLEVSGCVNRASFAGSNLNIPALDSAGLPTKRMAI